eukprot:1194589-Prorocentrum_minimum.AAC.8
MSVRCYYYHYHSYCLRTASCAPWTSRVSSRHAASGSTCCARDTTKTFTTTKYMTTSSGSKINCAHREGYDTPGKLPVASTPAASRVGGNIRKGIRVASRSDTFKLATKTRDATGGRGGFPPTRDAVGMDATGNLPGVSHRSPDPTNLYLTQTNPSVQNPNSCANNGMGALITPEGIDSMTLFSTGPPVPITARVHSSPQRG